MRAQIVVDGAGVAFYLHDRGHPPHVLPILRPLVRQFAIDRGLWDRENLAVHVVYEFTRRHLEYWEDFINVQVEVHGRTRHSQQEVKYCGLGLERFDGTLHADLDYVYVHYHAPVECLEVRAPKRAFAADPVLENTKLVSRTDWLDKPVRLSRRRHKRPVANENTRNLEL